MDTKKIGLEQISAFADGELTDGQPEAIIAALRQEDGKHAWDIYHSIGDVLRSDDLAFAMRPDFAARVAARLEAEPTVVSPHAKLAQEQDTMQARGAGSVLRRYAIPGVAAAAVAVALIGAPQWVASVMGGGPGNTAVVALAPSASGGHSQVVAVKAQDGVILRDPRIDDYLLAHQRFSPSVYSTAQYARSAAFSSDTNK